MKDWTCCILIGSFLVVAAVALHLVQPDLNWLAVGIFGAAGVGILLGLFLANQEVDVMAPAILVAAIAGVAAYFVIHLACILTFVFMAVAAILTFDWFDENHEHTRPPINGQQVNVKSPSIQG